ncbi:MAG: hypothetical protein NWE89_07665 [Candidatus Bathyarchaeota archaeon]|nr:hypothetical protein [Candidatus Bathyarchaeota archaeon]
MERMVRSIEFTVLAHATEDESKVKKAVLNLFPEGIDVPDFTRTKLQGYFGDPIVSLKLVERHRRLASELFDHILRNLFSLELTALIDELPQRIDDSRNLYMRFDKQKAHQGKLVFNIHDAIRVKTKLQLPHKSDPVEVMRSYIQTLTM